MTNTEWYDLTQQYVRALEAAIAVNPDMEEDIRYGKASVHNEEYIVICLNKEMFYLIPPHEFYLMNEYTDYIRHNSPINAQRVMCNYDFSDKAVKKETTKAEYEDSMRLKHNKLTVYAKKESLGHYPDSSEFLISGTKLPIYVVNDNTPLGVIAPFVTR